MAAGRSARPGEPKPEAAANRLGLVVSDLSEEKRRELQLPGGVGGGRGARRSRAPTSGAGDVILAVTAKGATTEVKTRAVQRAAGEIDKAPRSRCWSAAAKQTLRTIRGDDGRAAEIRRGEASICR